MEETHKLDPRIAYATSLTHWQYASLSTAKWYFMLFRIVELLERVKKATEKYPDQLVVLSCFQVRSVSHTESYRAECDFRPDYCEGVQDACAGAQCTCELRGQPAHDAPG